MFNAIRWSDRLPSLRSMLLLDGVGILIVQLCLLGIAILHHYFMSYIVFWLILERVIGGMMQARDHLEHYALWSTTSHHQLTQLYACRNLKTSPWLAWCMGGLNHHAIHHAFPGIPFNRLSEAFDRVQTVLGKYHLPLMSLGHGYVEEVLNLSIHPSLISEGQPADARGRHAMIAL